MNAIMDLLSSFRPDTAVVTVGAMVCVMIAVVAAAAAVRSMGQRRDVVVERLERTVGRADSEIVAPAGPSLLSRLLQPIAWLAKPTKAAELSRLRLRLVQAGYRGPYAMETFLAVKLIAAAAAVVGFLAMHDRVRASLRFPLDLVVALWMCGLGFLLPNIWLSARRTERQTQIARGLPDAMDLMVTCVEAGLGIDAAISRVAEEIGIASPLLGAELNLTFLEIQAGVPRAEAFRRLSERTGVEDLRALSAMLIQTEMFGTSVARALRVHSEGMRVRRMQRAEEKAAMVGVKMTIPLILCILPALVAILVGPAVTAMMTQFFRSGR